ncbi:NAD(P)H-dependent oxidoreductase subunit E [Sphaerotilus sp.]|uniref:NAD(P)H-dependent oxidoreductase subunit E n=1 Tax=Sphaerotilus sp. TaxID=2093942 RepID=UPI002ACE8B73|nr:NAD(P)H-dependent oxidoreductase subunit E [Sphaerotilus sp.]MDZ7858734.1 NAD(P)H-dependent oxidoreductase subunit E [Sphaerotilus sp.]
MHPAPPPPSSPAASSDDLQVVRQALDRHRSRPEQLVQILREVQAEICWLPRPVLAAIAAGLGCTLAHVEAVAGFYRFFHLKPVGRWHLLWSDAVSDRMLGSRDLAHELCRLLRLEPGRVSEDGRVSVGFASCTGWPDQGPALLVNHHAVITRMDAARVVALADLVRRDVPLAQWPAEWFRLDVNIQRRGVLLDEATPDEPGRAVRAALARGAEGVLAEVAASRLRGRGGAGFSTATKWRLARAAAVPTGGTRVVVCNADEGEPGTFKDRALLMTQAEAVFDGMTAAAVTLGAGLGFIYLRGEYRVLLDDLEARLAQRRAAGLLGPGLAALGGPAFDIAIHLGAGAYVCGEESALLESLEGQRGTPRIRPPFPVESGYLHQPTVVNNVETFVAIAHIVVHGGAWWANLGTAESSGTKLHSVAGDCARPGVYEFAFGVTVREVLQACGAERTQAVQVGGPSGVCLAPHEFDRRLGFEDVPTAGAFTVFDDRRDMFDVARGYSQFFAHESCGLCTPCRVGTELVRRRMDKLAAGRGAVPDTDELAELEALLHGATHCGLGATATNPLRDTLLRFRPAYERRVQGHAFGPAFDLDAELAPARQASGRDDAHAHLTQHPLAHPREDHQP